MSKSNTEEIIGCLWLIAALLAFENSYRGWGYIFVVLVVIAQIGSICFAIKAKYKDKDND